MLTYDQKKLRKGAQKAMMDCWLSLKSKHDLCIPINLRTTSRINGYSNKAVEVGPNFGADTGCGRVRGCNFNCSMC